MKRRGFFNAIFGAVGLVAGSAPVLSAQAKPAADLKVYSVDVTTHSSPEGFSEYFPVVVNINAPDAKQTAAEAFLQAQRRLKIEVR